MLIHYGYEITLTCQQPTAPDKTTDLLLFDDRLAHTFRQADGRCELSPMPPVR